MSAVTIARRSTRWVVIPVGAPIVTAFDAPERQGSDDEQLVRRSVVTAHHPEKYRIVRIDRIETVTPEVPGSSVTGEGGADDH